MKKKVLAILLATMTLSLTFTGCTITIGNGDDSSKTTIESNSDTNEEDEDTDDVKVKETEAQEKKDKIESANNKQNDTEIATEAATETEADSKTNSSGDISLDELKFYINGKAYVLGQSTLQNLIDDGVPFSEGELDTASNTVKPNSETSFKITLGEYWSGTVSVMNTTDNAETASNLPLSEVYLPTHNNTGETQNILSFDIPTDISVDEFMSRTNGAAETTEYSSGAVDVDYTRESTMYFGDYGYKLSYDDKGELSYITIDYLP